MHADRKPTARPRTLGTAATLLIAVLLATPAADAQRGLAASVSPAQTATSLTAAQTLRLSWQIDAEAAVTARSTEGRLIDAGSGRLLDTVPTTLALTAPGTVGETLVLSRERLASAAASGAGSLLYQRQWQTLDGRTTSAQLRIALTGSLAGGFAIQDLRLRFADGAEDLRIVEQNSTLSAIAEIAFSGRGGVIEYEWRIADPGTTRTEPVFVRLARRRLEVRGPSPLRLSSPPLPTPRSGPYLLEFRIVEPLLAVDPPLLGYVVQPAAQAGPAELRLLAPADGASLVDGAAFRWATDPGAATYQLEIYADDADQRLTGVIIPASVATTALSDVARLRLAQGCRCRWRVLAYDAQGEVRGISALRAVLIPPQETADEQP
jgi:hypothetical protein